MEEQKSPKKEPESRPWGKLVPSNPKFDTIEISKNSICFGRHQNNDFVFNDINISGIHCKIFRDQHEGDTSNIVFVEDLSTNGVHVNKGKIGKGNKILIRDGDEVCLLLLKKAPTDSIAYVYYDCIDKDNPEQDEQKELLAKYELLEQLGEGTFAVVRRAVNRSTGEHFAAKIIDKKKFTNKNRRSNPLLNEVEVLTKLKHKAIIGIWDIFETATHLYLVLELVSGGELFDRILNEEKLSEEKARHLFRQMLDAVQYMHKQGIAHRDLKPENILLKTKDSDEIKISDFGLSRIVDEGVFMKTMCGTPQYVAPEILTSAGQQGYGVAVDLWSLGVILYIMLCGFPPFDQTRGKLWDLIKTANYTFPDQYWKHISPYAKDLIGRLLTVDPEKRYTVEQALTHHWMTESLGQHINPLILNQNSVEQNANDFEQSPEDDERTVEVIKKPHPRLTSPELEDEEPRKDSSEEPDDEEDAEEKPKKRKAKASSAPEKKAKGDGKRLCGICRQPGHDRRRCPNTKKQ